MKKTYLLLAYLLVYLCISCEKYPDKINVNLEQAGKVTIEVVDKEGKPLEGAEIKIAPRTLLALEKGVTDSEGMYHSSDLLSGDYNSGAYYRKGRLTYSETKNHIVAPGKDIALKLSPLTNCGNLNLKIESMHDPNKGRAHNLDVALVPNTQVSLDNIDLVAYAIAKSNENNEVFFLDIPVEIHYYVIVYDKAAGIIYSLDPLRVTIIRGKTCVDTIHF